MEKESKIGSGQSVYMSDLALERRSVNTSIDGVDYKRERSVGGVWERITIRSEEGASSIGRPMGIYDTLTLSRMDTLDPDELDDAKEEIARELCSICEREEIHPDRILVVGLGNENLTPDAIGPRTALKISPTLHLSRGDRGMFNAFECSEIAVIAPGVKSASGIDASDVIDGVCMKIHPDAVIAIDALASRSQERLGTTVQISSVGIIPGSGLGLNTKAINKETLGIPVISIGVPTVINSVFLKDKDSEESEKEMKGMFVSPREIDGIVKNASELIAGGINQAFGIIY